MTTSKPTTNAAGQTQYRFPTETQADAFAAAIKREGGETTQQRAGRHAALWIVTVTKPTTGATVLESAALPPPTVATRSTWPAADPADLARIHWETLTDGSLAYGVTVTNPDGQSLRIECEDFEAAKRIRDELNEYASAVYIDGPTEPARAAKDAEALAARRALVTAATNARNLIGRALQNSAWGRQSTDNTDSADEAESVLTELTRALPAPAAILLDELDQPTPPAATGYSIREALEGLMQACETARQWHQPGALVDGWLNAAGHALDAADAPTVEKINAAADYKRRQAAAELARTVEGLNGNAACYDCAGVLDRGAVRIAAGMFARLRELARAALR